MGEDAVFEPHHEHHRVLEALGRVQRHEHDRRIVVVELIGVGDEADLFEELVDIGELAGHAHQLGEVLDAPIGLDRVVGFELGHIARRFQDLFEHRRGSVADLGAAGVEHPGEVVESTHGAPGDPGLGSTTQAHRRR